MSRDLLVGPRSVSGSAWLADITVCILFISHYMSYILGPPQYYLRE